MEPSDFGREIENDREALRRRVLLSQRHARGDAGRGERVGGVRTHAVSQCRYCGSLATVKFGLSVKGDQRFLCHSCGKVSVDNDAPPGMRFPTLIIARVLDRYFEGASLNQIREVIGIEFGVRPDSSTIHRWVSRYSNLADRLFSTARVPAGPLWVAQEDEISIGSRIGERVWVWDVADVQSGFVLASAIAAERTTTQVSDVVTAALARSLMVPKSITVARLGWCLPEIVSAVAGNTDNYPVAVESGSLPEPVVRRFHRRDTLLHPLTSVGTARRVLRGWVVANNYFRRSPDEEIPAAVIGVTPRYRSWVDVVQARSPQKEK